MHLQNLTLFIVLLLMSSLAEAQQLSTETQEALDSLRLLKSIPISEFIYPDSSNFELDRVASNEELLFLTDDESEVIRVAVMMLLLNRKNTEGIDFSKLFARHLFDTTEVQFETPENGSFYMRKGTVNSVYAQMIGNYFGQIGAWLPSQKYKASKEEQHFMDSLMICERVQLDEEMASLVWRLDAVPEFYIATRKKVIQDKDRLALAYLAKYKKEEDVDLILGNLTKRKERRESRWNPFHYFQHPRLFQCLKDSLNSCFKDSRYLERIAQYKNKAAVDLLNEAYLIFETDKRKLHFIRGNLARSIQNNYCEHFADLYMKILSENAPGGYFIIPEVLWIDRGAELYELYHLWNKSKHKRGKEAAEKLYPGVKAYVEKQEPENVPTLILDRIVPGEEYRNFFSSFEYIYKSKDSVFIDPLFEIIRKEPRGGYRYFIAKMLLNFEGEGVKGRLITFYNLHPDMAPDIAAAEKGGQIYGNLLHRIKRNKE